MTGGCLGGKKGNAELKRPTSRSAFSLHLKIERCCPRQVT